MSVVEESKPAVDYFSALCCSEKKIIDKLFFLMEKEKLLNRRYEELETENKKLKEENQSLLENFKKDKKTIDHLRKELILLSGFCVN